MNKETAQNTHTIKTKGQNQDYIKLLPLSPLIEGLH